MEAGQTDMAALANQIVRYFGRISRMTGHEESAAKREVVSILKAGGVR